MGIFNLFKPNVERLEAKGDVEGLTKALQYKKDLKVRWEAVKALSKIGEPSVEAFVQALTDESELVRWEAAMALGELKDEKAVEPLIQALKDKHEWVRWKAAEALGELKDERAVEPLFQALNDESRWVREEAVEALGKIGESAGEVLFQALNHESERVRKRAAELLGKMGFWSIIQTFESIFERFEITHAQEASIYYILSINDPSLNFTEMLGEAVKIKRTVSQGALKKGRDDLLSNGLLARVLFPNNAGEELEQNEQIPVHPKILFEEHEEYLRELYEPDDFSIRKKQVEHFYGVYADNYGKYGLKLDKGRITLHCSRKWIVSYIASIIAGREVKVDALSMMLSGLGVLEEPYRDYYEERIKSGTKIRMIFGGEEEIEEIEEAKELRNEYEEDIEIRYTPSISRTCKSFIIDDTLAMDGKKLLARDEEEPLYIGIMYLQEEECIKNLRRDFEAKWKMSKVLL
jgi:phosphoribosyl-ATP pyrophosphohydrolase